MSLLYLILEIIFILQVSILAVKIGVSKISTTTSTTLEPNISLSESETTVTFPTQTTTSSNMETSTLATIINDTIISIPEFPPKITKPTRRTSTAAPVTTTSKASSNDSTSNMTTAMNFPILETSNHVLSSKIDIYCPCDLTPSTCDLNCCCDLDCAKEILKVFDCFSPSKYPDHRFIIDGFQYEHGLPSCKINDGWLCVFRTNTRASAKKEYSFNFDTTNNYKWPHFLIELTETVQEKERDFYKYGDQLKVLNMDNADIQDFSIPYDYKPPFCQISYPIRHLMPISRNCLIPSLRAALEIKQKYFNFFATTKLLSKPRHQPTYLEDMKDLVKDVQLKSCTRKNGSKDLTCTELNVFSNETEAHESENYVSETHIKFFHNFTNLLGCQIEFIEEELLTNEETLELWQKYSVVFIALNETESNADSKNFLLNFSGPLGYLQGEPIIVSKYVANNDSEELNAQNRILNYFKSPNSINNTLSLLSQQSGLCYKKYDKYFNINYGISSLTQCTLRIDKESLIKLNPSSLKKANFTRICVRIQEQILERLFKTHAYPQVNDLTEIQISTLGRPKNSTDKWLPLQVQNIDFTPVSGQLTLESQTLICRNILLSAAYEFHIGKFTENGISQQALVKNAILKLGQRHDLEFQFDERLEVPLTLTVMFYDLSLNAGPLVNGGWRGVIYLALMIFNFRITYFFA